LLFAIQWGLIGSDVEIRLRPNNSQRKFRGKKLMSNEQQARTWQLSDMHHLGLTVSDIEKSIHFYRDLLGMTLVNRRPSVTEGYVAQQTGYESVELNVASFKINEASRQSMEVVQYMNNAGDPTTTETNRAGNSHFCVLVDDLMSCYTDLLAQGVKFKSEPVRITAGPNEGGLVIYLFDPDGYMLELFQPAR